MVSLLYSKATKSFYLFVSTFIVKHIHRFARKKIVLPKGSPPEIHANRGIWALPKWLLHPPPRTQTGTLGHSAPNHPGNGLDPPKIK